MAQINSFKAQLTPSRIQGGKGERQGNKTSEERMRKKYEEAPSLKKKKPEDITEPHIEGGRTYYWCTKHQMFTMHKSADCKLPKCNNFYRENSAQKEESKDNPKENNKKTTYKLKKDEETKLQYTGPQSNVSIDQEYKDY
jgi:hypothetical protein